jgi:hypothetical protein
MEVGKVFYHYPIFQLISNLFQGRKREKCIAIQESFMFVRYTVNLPCLEWGSEKSWSYKWLIQGLSIVKGEFSPIPDSALS